MGEKVRIDDRWRIVIPIKYRKGLKPKDELIVEMRGSELILRKASREDILKEFNQLKIYLEEDLTSLNAEKGKHRYGGYKD